MTGGGGGEEGRATQAGIYCWSRVADGQLLSDGTVGFPNLFALQSLAK